MCISLQTLDPSTPSSLMQRALQTDAKTVPRTTRRNPRRTVVVRSHMRHTLVLACLSCSLPTIQCAWIRKTTFVHKMLRLVTMIVSIFVGYRSIIGHALQVMFGKPTFLIHDRYLDQLAASSVLAIHEGFYLVKHKHFLPWLC
jgi:hypothetical protein